MLFNYLFSFPDECCNYSFSFFLKSWIPGHLPIKWVMSVYHDIKLKINTIVKKQNSNPVGYWIISGYEVEECLRPQCQCIYILKLHEKWWPIVLTLLKVWNSFIQHTIYHHHLVKFTLFNPLSLKKEKKNPLHNHFF